MSLIKEAFYNTLASRGSVDEEIEEYGHITNELADKMVAVIDKLEYELALYHAGCNTEQVQKIMSTTYEGGNCV